MPDTLDVVYKKLKDMRTRSDLKLRKPKYMRDTYTDFDGTEKPLNLRYYQVQGVLHLVLMKRFLLGDDCGLGKTPTSIAALCSIWEKEPDKKVMILTTKSAAKQWYNEFFKFTSGIRVILCKGSPVQREAARDLFEKSTGPTVIIMGYRSAVQDFRHLQNWENGIVIYDEATAFKNTTTQVHQVCKYLASKADRVYGLTATLIKNNLMEGYGIYQVILPGLFGMSKNQFMLYYCLTRMQKLPRSNRQIPVIVGYLPAKIQEFKGVIDPYYIGRPKHEVASELPSLTTQVVEVEMSPEQESKYAEALAGLLTLGEGDDAAVKEVSKLTAISYCQEIVNHLGLIDCVGESGKLDALVDLLTEGEFEDEKVIIYSRFRKMVDIIMNTLAVNKIKAVRITGSENTNQRDEAMVQFQDPKSDVRVICITAAGSESLNLQAAKAVVCYDTPWSAGEFLQLIGRMIRIGSVHDRCFVVHLVARGEKKKTIDHRVMEVLGKKMQLIEAVLGKRIKGEGDQVAISAQNEISDLFASLKQDAKDTK
jgi:SNF2 family DNA or RNA helicase